MDLQAPVSPQLSVWRREREGGEREGDVILLIAFSPLHTVDYLQRRRVYMVEAGGGGCRQYPPKPGAPSEGEVKTGIKLVNMFSPS